jgi:valyl-tRNA synthetase
MLAALAEVVTQATDAFDAFDYARALETTERSFWSWTDDYLELVKGRAYEGGSSGASAHAALQLSLSIYLRLFAPFLPFVTEEAWSWWHQGSVHHEVWPGSTELGGLGGDPSLLAVTSAVLSAVRRAKSDAKASMRAEVASVSVSATPGAIQLIRQAETDLMTAARAAEMAYVEGEFSVESILVDVSSG